MGLFDFALDMGRKLFEHPEDASQSIKREIESAKLGIEGLGVDFKDGTVFLSGKAPSQEALEKTVLLAGNVVGVKSINIDKMTKPASTLKVEYYVIEKGDNLSKIAKRFLGDANRYQDIFAANREVIRDPNLIFPGQKIRIPM